MRSGRRLKKFNPKVKYPKINDTPPNVNATGKPSNSMTKTVPKNIKGRASKLSVILEKYFKN